MGSLTYWRGRSRFDGTPIVASLSTRSMNKKTGDIPALWIEPARVSAGACPASVCGTCPQRNGGCYVDARLSISVRRAAIGRRVAPWSAIAAAVSGRTLRLGAHGDPAALPAGVVDRIARAAADVVGYTHAWRRAPWLRRWCMASVESPADAALAQAAGWRTYRIRPPGAPLLVGELQCPATTHGVTCARCRLCGGGSKARAPSIGIEVHGGAVARRVAVAEP